MQTIEFNKTSSRIQAKPEQEQAFFAPSFHARQEGAGKAGSGGNNTVNPRFFPARPHTVVQPKRSINEPDDQYEQEADAMADRVMRMSVKPAGGPADSILMRAPEDKPVRDFSSLIPLQKTLEKFSSSQGPKRPLNQPLFPCPDKRGDNKKYALARNSFYDQPASLISIFNRTYGEKNALEKYQKLDQPSKKVLFEVYNRLLQYGLDMFVDSLGEIDAHGTGNVNFTSTNKDLLLEQFLLFQLCQLYCLDDINILHKGDTCFREMSNIGSFHLCIGGGNDFNAHLDKISPVTKSRTGGACLNDFSGQSGLVAHILNEAIPEILKKVILKNLPVLHLLSSNPKVDFLKFLPGRNPFSDQLLGDTRRFDQPSIGSKKLDIVNIFELPINDNWRFELNYSWFNEPEGLR